MRINVKFTDNTKTIGVKFNSSLQKLNTTMQDRIIGGNPYTGNYEVTPKALEQQELPTADRFLTENVLVLAIPKYSVDNASGGTTITIGGNI